MAAGDNAYWSDLANLINKPIVRLVQTVAQTGIANNTITAVTFTSEAYDTHGFHDTSTNTSRITPSTAGYYRFDGAAALAGQTDYIVVEAFIRQNGSTGIPGAGRHAGITSSGNSLVEDTGSVLLSMNGTTDYVELCLRFNRSGAGTSSTVISSQFTCVLQAEYLRPL